MIELSEQATSVIESGSRVTAMRMQSWLDDVLLADDIPVASGIEECDRSLRVPERVSLVVPRRDRGTDWAPVANDDPLGANGQTVHIELGVAGSGGQTEWFTRGWFVISDADPVGDDVRVEASGLLYLIEEARLVSPFQPSGTIAAAIRSLVEPAITVQFDPALVDRAVPAAVNYDEDRLGALNELLDAWPADARVDADGVLQVFPAVQSIIPVFELSTLEDGLAMAAEGKSTRDGAFNVVVARGTAADGAQVQGVAYDEDPDSPKRYSGPFSPLPVPHYYASPLMTTTAQCNAAAATVLARLRRTGRREHRVSAVPDPRVQLDDVAALTTSTVSAVPCAVEHLRLPYLADGGPMALTVRELA